ncbi:MAG TPA: host attachment protein [Myxococcaceae bacterium]|nr:host attachment protein [Myxococcaceae bacterium]
MNDETTVALVADASRANLFRVEVATGQWTPLEALGHPEGRMHDRDLKDDRRVENAGTKHGPPPEDDPHGRHKLEAQRFANHLAAELARLYDEQVFRRLVLVAPPELIGFLRKEMPKRVAESVIEELTRDLSNVRPDELSERIPIPHA